MATIGKITTAKSGTAAIEYAYGKDKLPKETKSWLLNQGVDPEIIDNLHDRAVVMDGINTDPKYAKTQMLATRKLLNIKGRECTRIIQSFSSEDLSATNPKDWIKANEIGLELAKKAFPDYQVAIYTHLDGEGHKLHNHIILNMPNLQTGKKYHEHQSWRRISKISDEICLEHGLSIIQDKDKRKVRKTMAELKRSEKGLYVWKDDLRERIDNALIENQGQGFEKLAKTLANSNVTVQIRGSNITFSFIDKDGKQRKARGKTLGSQYDKENIENESTRRNGRNIQKNDSRNRGMERERERERGRGLGLSGIGTTESPGQSRKSNKSNRTRPDYRKQIEAVEQQIQGIEQSCNGIRRSQQNIREGQQDIEEQQRTLRERQQGVENQQRKIGTGIAKLRGSTNRLKDRINEIATAIRERIKNKLLARKAEEAKQAQIEQDQPRRIYKPKRGRSR